MHIASVTSVITFSFVSNPQPWSLTGSLAPHTPISHLLTHLTLLLGPSCGRSSCNNLKRTRFFLPSFFLSQLPSPSVHFLSPCFSRLIHTDPFPGHVIDQAQLSPSSHPFLPHTCPPDTCECVRVSVLDVDVREPHPSSAL